MIRIPQTVTKRDDQQKRRKVSSDLNNDQVDR